MRCCSEAIIQYVLFKTKDIVQKIITMMNNSILNKCQYRYSFISWIYFIILYLSFDLLPFYAILRSIPNKLIGVLAMFGSLLILLVMPLVDLSRIRGNQFRPAMRVAFWFFVVNFFILMWIGACHPETPFLEIGQFSTAFYFLWFLVIVPGIGLSENTLFDVATE
jgi:quinol-cytochrome oxidoreductase complex cytochrome b subunit